jgi:hypothetical protein
MKREKKIGKLKKAFGLKGYATALPGHAVYDDGERFVIYLNHPTSIERLRVPFYKDTLRSDITFYKTTNRRGFKYKGEKE